MALYRIDVSDGTDTNTVYADVGWRYTKNLNEVNEAELKFSGTGATIRGLLKIGATVYIYKNGTIDFQGMIDNTDYFVGGTVVFHASGWEVKLAKENGTYSGSPWTSTASATIFAAIIGESSYISAGTIDAGYSMDFRLTTSTSLFNAISNLANKTGQDISMNYSTLAMSILNHVGSTTSVAVLNEGKEITNLRRSEGYPRGNNIIVWGKGDGDNQIKGAANDATSIAAYGTITMNVTDASVMSTNEADRLASAELALNKDPPNIYDFELTNSDRSDLSLGDVITLNALDQDVSNEEVRIVGIEEGYSNSGPYITLQTTNPELKTLMKTKNKILAKLKKDTTDDETYMGGTSVTNEFGTGINADSSHYAKVGFYVPPEFETEDGSLTINWLRVDYDIDPFNSQFGTASFSGGDPQVHNDSGDTGPYVSGTSAETTLTSTIGSDSGTEAVSDSSWDLIASDTLTNGTYGMIFVDVSIEADGWSGSDIIYIKITIDGTTWVVQTGISFRTALGFRQTFAIPLLASSYLSECRIYMISDLAEDYTVSFTVYADPASHDHGDGSYAAADHSHPDGSYDIDSADLDDITIGDSVSEAGSVNSSGVTIYLDYWNGSSWDNKHSIEYASDTLKTNVDMTDGGTYPDADGYWRVTVKPSSAAADFVNVKVRMKVKIDN